MKNKLDITNILLLAGGLLVAGYILLEITEPGKPFRETLDSLIVGSGGEQQQQQPSIPEEQQV